nr:ATP-binding protein [Cryptomonas curvata]
MIGLIVLGASGCGKTTFCCAMKKFVNSTEEHPIFVNLDPGNNLALHKIDINIQELINSFEIMPELNLGPNGSFLYSIEYFERNGDWFENKFSNLIKKSDHYFLLFDFPGQIELFTHHVSVRKFVKKILFVKMDLVGITLSDSFFFKDNSSKNSLLLISIIMMLNIELPHVHLLSKSDLLNYQNLTSNFDNFHFDKFKYTIKNIQTSCFSWSKKLLYDFTQLITEFSVLNIIPVSIYFPNSIKIIYKKVKSIIKL